MRFENGLKTIVVATDLGGEAGAALVYARKLAEKFGARVVLAHGLVPIEDGAATNPVIDDRTANASRVLDELAEDLVRIGIHSHSEVRQGAVPEMLVDVAQKHKAELIVIGAKGIEGAGPVVVSAIAEQLLRLADCPVLIVAEDWIEDASLSAASKPVLLAIEQNDPPAAAESACSLAQAFARPLLVLQVRSGEEETEASTSPRADRLEDLGIQVPGNVQVRCLAKMGNRDDAIADAIAENHPGLLVVGVQRANGRPVLHGMAFILLLAARVPVLCVPPAAS
jgi:nucleotide-binding universal stress UspA family protein